MAGRYKAAEGFFSSISKNVMMLAKTCKPRKMMRSTRRRGMRRRSRQRKDHKRMPGSPAGIPQKLKNMW